MPELPKCCDREMSVAVETAKFFEARCGTCGDVVYIKKGESKKPQMLDD